VPLGTDALAVFRLVPKAYVASTKREGC